MIIPSVTHAQLVMVRRCVATGPGVQWSAQIDDTPPIVSPRHTRPTEVLLLPLPHKPRAPQTCV